MNIKSATENKRVKLLGPFDLEDEMVITVVVDAPDGSLRVILVGECDKGETARHILIFILGQERAQHFSERLEQLLNVGLGGLFRQVAHSHSVIVLKPQKTIFEWLLTGSKVKRSDYPCSWMIWSRASCQPEMKTRLQRAWTVACKHRQLQQQPVRPWPQQPARSQSCPGAGPCADILNSSDRPCSICTWWRWAKALVRLTSRSCRPPKQKVKYFDDFSGSILTISGSILTSLLLKNCIWTSSLTTVVAEFKPGGSLTESPNFRHS